MIRQRAVGARAAWAGCLIALALLGSDREAWGFHVDKGSALLVGGSPEPFGDPPKQTIEYQKAKGKSSQQGVSYFEPVAKERRPELGSLLLLLLTNALSIVLIGSNSWIGMGFGVVLAAWGTFGILVGWDAWSILRLII